MTDVSPPTSSGVNLALRAIIDHRLQTFPLKDGLLIGSDSDCDIRVANARPKHLKVLADQWGNWRVAPADADVMLRDGGNADCAWLPLRRSTMFVVEKTIFDCVQIIPESEQEDLPRVDRHSCPRCRTNLVDVDLSASFCPHCGAPLPADCPEWPLVTTDAPDEPKPLPRWMMWLPPSLRARVARDPLFFARRTTVLAYINTFFNLGLKHEVGVDGDRNLPEAMRYYQKAAQLGNVPARARLKAKENANV